jgi:hypothetical protein
VEALALATSCDLAEPAAMPILLVDREGSVAEAVVPAKSFNILVAVVAGRGSPNSD